MERSMPCTLVAEKIKSHALQRRGPKKENCGSRNHL